MEQEWSAVEPEGEGRAIGRTQWIIITPVVYQATSDWIGSGVEEQEAGAGG